MKENISVSSLSSSYIIITWYNNKLAKYRTHPIILPKVSLQYTIISANDSCPHYLSFPPPSVVTADTPFINKLKNAIIFQFLDIIRLFFPYFVPFFQRFSSIPLPRMSFTCARQLLFSHNNNSLSRTLLFLSVDPLARLIVTLFLLVREKRGIKKGEEILKYIYLQKKEKPSGTSASRN